MFLYSGFKDTAGDAALFVSVFHSVSAFCNAGFSLFSENLVNYTTNYTVCITIMLLIISGGIGFVVIQDIGKRIRHKTLKLSLHTKVVIVNTMILIVAGAVVYLLFEMHTSFRNLTTGQMILASFFQSVTPRTAGFNTINQAAMTLPSKVFTLPLMLIGGSPGSISGGVKVTTAFLVIVSAFRGMEAGSELRIGRRKISGKAIAKANMFMLKAMLLLFCGTFMLTITEISLRSDSKAFLEILFECFSAFGTVGLSLGITPELTAPGKIVVILMMFAGRVGLISMAMSVARRVKRDVDYPVGEVLIG
ncbi:MAG: potassium transporter TrkG, partial [Spirochaetota bacterium]